MRITDTDFLTEMVKPNLKPAFLLEAEFNSGYVYLWTGQGVLNWNSQDWRGIGGAIQFSTFSDGAGIRADGIELVMSFAFQGLKADPQVLARTALEETKQGAPCRVYLALFRKIDDGGWEMAGEPTPCFRGQVDIPRLGGIPGPPVFQLSIENRMVRFKTARGGLYSPEEQKRRFPGDLGLDFMPELAQSQTGIGRGYDVSFGGGGTREFGPPSYKDVAPFDGGPIAPIGPQGGLGPVGGGWGN